jgi:hypothetical protein
MKTCTAIALILACGWLTACQSGRQSRARDDSGWELNGVTHPNSAEYMAALHKDRFFRTYPPMARLDDFRAFDDMRLGAYYYYYVKNPGPGEARLSTFALRDLRQAMRERGVTDEWFETIAGSSLRAGMPLTALYAAWGTPWNGYRSQSRQGELIQHIYLDEDGEQIHVFTLNGIVTAWRD